MTESNAKLAGIFSLLTLSIAIIGAATALILYWIEDFSFFPWRNYISDLSVGLNGSSTVFIIMMVFLGQKCIMNICL